jgi:3-dehydroquinate synthase
MMMKIPSEEAISYPIVIAPFLINSPIEWLPENWQRRRLVIITDDHVGPLYSNILYDSLKILCDNSSDVKHKPLLLSITPGEKSKNYHTQMMLIEKMIEHHCDRNTLILALGGGVVGDISGYVAATFMRGIPYIQVPTTLLAMVDSSVGGKTGINLKHGKNLVGAFWQPSVVAIDLNCLKTLTEMHLINGLIEAIKIFLTNDADYFNYTCNHLDALLTKDLTRLKPVVETAIKHKVSIVSEDPKEKNKRMIVNFGHTIGHALEALTDYTLLHGYAVALGILVEAKISQILGFLRDDEFAKIQSLLQKLNLTALQLQVFDADAIINATHVDKKVKSNQVRYVLLKQIGEVYHGDDNGSYAHPVSDVVVKRALIELSEV